MTLNPEVVSISCATPEIVFGVLVVPPPAKTMSVGLATVIVSPAPPAVIVAVPLPLWLIVLLLGLVPATQWPAFVPSRLCCSRRRS